MSSLSAGFASSAFSVVEHSCATGYYSFAHELGHNLSLLHVDEGMKDNLMKGHVKLRLGPAQIKQARAQARKGPQIALDEIEKL